MDETFKLKPGEELVLTAPKKDPARKGRRPHQRRRGPLDTARRGEYLPRRNKKSVLNLYDMGQLKDPDTGLFSDVFLGVPKEIFPFEVPPGIGDVLPSEWTDIATYLTSIPNRATRFKKLEKSEAHKYGVNLKLGAGAFEIYDASNPKFKDAGYELTGAISTIGLQFNGGLGQFFISSEHCKITALPVYTAPAVALGLSGAVNCFIAPGLANTVASGTAPDLNFHWLGFYYDIIPRFFLEVTPNSPFEVAGTFADDAALNEALALLRAHPGTQNVFTVDGSHLLSGGSLPDAGAGLASGAASFGVSRDSGSVGSLLAILEGTGGPRYIWSSENVGGVGSGVQVIQE